MNNDRLKLLFIESTITLSLLITLIVSNRVSNLALALVLIVFYIIVRFIFKKEKVLSINSKKVNIFLTISALLYVGIFYLMGIFINSYLHMPISLTFKSLLNIISPLILIIIFSELIRLKLVSQEINIHFFKKKINISLVLTFIMMVLVDMIIYTRTYSLTSLDNILMITGYVFFSSISCNLFFMYVAGKYGIKGIIVYRLITILYVYILPYAPDMYVFFKTFFRMLYPFLMYMTLEMVFEDKKEFIPKNQVRKNNLLVTIPIITMTLFVALISCKFKYGTLVIGSNSMNPKIKIGSVVIFEKNDKKIIKEGDVIVFWKNNVRTVHRIVKIEKINGISTYYTKGDANLDIDKGFIYKKDIIGIVDFKIKYIGYPSLWFRKMIEK